MLKSYTIHYTESNELFYDVEAESEEGALAEFERHMTLGNVDFSELEITDSNVEVIKYEDAPDDELDEIISRLEEYLVAHLGFDKSDGIICKELSLDEMSMTDVDFFDWLAGSAGLPDERVAELSIELIREYLETEVLDVAMHSIYWNAREVEIINERWDDLESIVMDMDVSCDKDAIRDFIIERATKLARSAKAVSVDDD